MCGYKHHAIRTTEERRDACRRRREWHGVEIPGAEYCERVQLCGTDRRALGEEMY